MKFYIHSVFTESIFHHTSQSLLSYILPNVDHNLYDAIVFVDYNDVIAEPGSWLILPCTPGSDRKWPENFLDFILKNKQLNILLDYSGEPYDKIVVDPDLESTQLINRCLSMLQDRTGHVVIIDGSLDKNNLSKHIFGMPAQLIHHSIFTKEYYQHFYSIDNRIIKNVFKYATHDFLCLNGRSDPVRTSLVNRFLDSSQSIIYSLDRSELSNWGTELFWFLHRSIPVEKVCDSKIYIGTETITGSRNMFITEKTAKAFAMGKPFVIMGPLGIHKQLSEWGFRLFTDSQHDDTDISDVVEWTFDQAMKIKENYSTENYLHLCLHNLKLFHSVQLQRRLLSDYLLKPLSKNYG